MSQFLIRGNGYSWTCRQYPLDNGGLSANLQLQFYLLQAKILPEFLTRVHSNVILKFSLPFDSGDGL